MQNPYSLSSNPMSFDGRIMNNIKSHCSADIPSSQLKLVLNLATPEKCKTKLTYLA